jgi:hypothetical protein
VLKIVGWILGVVFVLAVVATGVARVIAGRKYSRHWTTHAVSFPIPFPLSAVEIETLRGERLAAGAPAADPLSGVDLEAAALTRAIIARGEHLVKTRVGCDARTIDDKRRANGRVTESTLPSALSAASRP